MSSLTSCFTMSSLSAQPDDYGALSAHGVLNPTAGKGASSLSSKVSAILSASYADTEFRESLALLDDRQVHSTSETRRTLRLDLQKEVIDSNGEIIDEFAKVAQVWPTALSDSRHGADSIAATPADRQHDE